MNSEQKERYESVCGFVEYLQSCVAKISSSCESFRAHIHQEEKTLKKMRELKAGFEQQFKELEEQDQTNLKLLSKAINAKEVGERLVQLEEKHVGLVLQRIEEVKQLHLDSKEELEQRQFSSYDHDSNEGPDT